MVSKLLWTLTDYVRGQTWWNYIQHHEREKSSILPTHDACKRIRADFVLVANGQEAGCGKVKFPGATTQLVEEDRARTAEILKITVCSYYEEQGPKISWYFWYDI